MPSAAYVVSYAPDPTLVGKMTYAVKATPAPTAAGCTIAVTCTGLTLALGGCTATASTS